MKILLGFLFIVIMGVVFIVADSLSAYLGEGDLTEALVIDKMYEGPRTSVGTGVVATDGGTGIGTVVTSSGPSYDLVLEIDGVRDIYSTNKDTYLLVEPSQSYTLRLLRGKWTGSIYGVRL